MLSTIRSADPSAHANPEVFRIQQLCPSIGKACGVGNFASNLEFSMREIGVEINTIASYKEIVPGDLLVQHEFGLFDTKALKSALKSHVGRKFLLAHSPRAGIFAKDVDAFIALCDGMVDTDVPTKILPHPGWQMPQLSRAELKEQMGWSEYDCVMGTNGFISTTRQFDQIVKRLVDFARDNNFLIYVACPRHNSHEERPSYIAQEQLLIAMAEAYPKNLQLEQRFLNQESLNHRFQACDLLWCWTGGDSAPYGSGTCSDQFASGTRIVVTNKLQHKHVFELQNVVVASSELIEFVEMLKAEAMAGNFDRHDPSPLSWNTFSHTLTDFLVTVPQSSPINASQTLRKEPDAAQGPKEVHQLIPDEYSVSDTLRPANAVQEANAYLNRIVAYPGVFRGRGIVICAGGSTYNTCAWVLVRVLRYLGCELPIEVWTYESEYDSDWAKLVELYDVEIRTLPNFTVNVPTRVEGWKLKPMAVLRSSFREVMLLDADNVPTRDPSYLFESSEYLSTGTIFWPDVGRTNPNSNQWFIFGVPFRSEWEQESGQLIVNKEVAWKSINLCSWYNVHSSLFYRYVYGDKDTFRLSWHRTETVYSMPKKGVSTLPYTLLQHDFNGEVIFQHRFGRKWNLKVNRPIPGFVHEDACMHFIEELRKKWQPVNRIPALNRLEPEANVELENRFFHCTRTGHSSWTLRFDPMGVINVGRPPCVDGWWVHQGRLILGTVNGSPVYTLEKKSEGVWQGKGPKGAQLHLAVQTKVEPEIYDVPST